MAVETHERQETVKVEHNGHQTRRRLHEEILPPALSASTPIAVRSARRALAILAAGIIVIQFASAPIGHQLKAVANSGVDAYTLWEHYASSPVPDVLVIGASPARTDFDEAGLSAELSTVAGHPVTVEKLGFAGQSALFLDAIVYRIMKRESHPKLIVVALEGPELNGGCNACLHSITGGLWDISDLTDLNFTRLALHLDPNPARLLAGWVLPPLAYGGSIIAMQCVVVDLMRAGATAVLGRVPRQLQNPTICEGPVASKWALADSMAQSDYVGSINNYREFMRAYRVSTEIASSVADMIARAHAGGTNIVFLQTPLHPGLRSSFPEAGQAYEKQLHILALSSSTGVIDLSQAIPPDPTLWVDGYHLDRAGAHYMQAQVAQQLLPYLSS